MPCIKKAISNHDSNYCSSLLHHPQLFSPSKVYRQDYMYSATPKSKSLKSSRFSWFIPPTLAWHCICSTHVGLIVTVALPHTHVSRPRYCWARCHVRWDRLGRRIANCTYFRACGQFWLSSVLGGRRVADEKRR